MKSNQVQGFYLTDKVDFVKSLSSGGLFFIINPAKLNTAYQEGILFDRNIGSWQIAYENGQFFAVCSFNTRMLGDILVPGNTVVTKSKTKLVDDVFSITQSMLKANQKLLKSLNKLNQIDHSKPKKIIER